MPILDKALGAIDTGVDTTNFDPEFDDEGDDKDYLASRTVWFLAAVLAVVLAVPAAGLALLTVPSGTPLRRTGAVMTPDALALSTSTESPAAVLNALAARVDQLPEGSPGRYEHVAFREWTLQAADSAPMATAVPNRQDVWLAPDGTGRRTSETAEITVPMPRYDRPLRATRGNETAPADPVQEAARLFGTGPMPANAKDLQKLLSRAPDLSVWDGIAALNRERVLEPATRGAVLRLLATLPGVSYRGTTTDQLGREGLAFTREGKWTEWPAQQTLVFDDTTGQLLATETLVTSYDGKLELSPPAVVSYDTFLSSDRTEEMDN